MKLRVLLLILLVLMIPLPLALFFGLFVDYADAGNRRYLHFHPGYYYHYWSSPRPGAGGATATEFRGGGPAFGK